VDATAPIPAEERAPTPADAGPPLPPASTATGCGLSERPPPLLSERPPPLVSRSGSTCTHGASFRFKRGHALRISKRDVSCYRGASLIRNSAPLGPYGSNIVHGDGGAVGASGPACVEVGLHLCAGRACQGYWGTSLMRKRLALGPYCKDMPRALWWSVMLRALR
jgi:hypothetical protein